MLEFFSIGQIAVTCVECLGKQQQSSKPVAVLIKLARMTKFVLVPFWMIRPDVFDLISLLPTAMNVIQIVRWHTRLGLNIGGHSSQHSMNLASISAVKSKSHV